jgi:hypothetical protein
MSFFRKCITTLSLLSSFVSSEAQQLDDFDVRTGIDPFFLGSIRTHQDSSNRLVEAGKSEYKGRTEYAY